MLIARIQKDLFDFVDQDPEDFEGLLEFWYQANSLQISAALSAQPGLNLIVNVSNFQDFENLSKKLFLVADTLVLRDTRKWDESETGGRAIPIPVDEYRPGYYNGIVDKLQLLRPSPLTLLYRPNLYWSSTTKRLNNGYQVAYAGWDYNSIPREFVEWIGGLGRSYMETGRIVYAPFIPSYEMELEFAKNDVNLPEYFNASPCFHQNYDWITDDQLKGLFSLQFPFLDRLDIRTISEIKEDNRDEFMAFSEMLLQAIGDVKSSFGTQAFAAELRHIQKYKIDAGVSDIKKTVKKLSSMNSLRKSGVAVGVLGLSSAFCFGISAATLVTGLAASGVAMVAAKMAQLKEERELRDKSPYFLWKLQQAAQTR